ncbi:MAG: hypothetical protein ACK6A7_05410, partial [Planctomycetota bacterium]
MTSLAQLDPPKASGLVVHILSSIAQLEKKFRPQQLLMSRYFASEDLPRLKRTDCVLNWLFELEGVSPIRGQFTTSVSIELDPKQLQHLDDITSSRIIRGITMNCSCTEAVKPCVHQIYCLNYLRRQLSQRSPSAAVEWMQSCLSYGLLAGRKLVESLHYLKTEEPVVEAEEPDEESARLQRIQWRLNINQYGCQIHAYLQTSRKRGGWNKGRLIRENFDSIPEEALTLSSDKMLVLLLQSAEDSYRGQTPRMIRECLR